MRARLITAFIAAAIFVVVIPANAGLAPDNPWLDRPPLNIAHQGGAKEAPSNTLYAFKRALKVGADVLELDVHATADRQLVVIHDATVHRTTNGEEGRRVDQMTLAQIKQLDAAFWWSPGRVDCHPKDYDDCHWKFRGVATGDKKPPKGYTANDFRVPTLDEVLTSFPDALINIEIKGVREFGLPDTIPFERELAQLLKHHRRSDDTIVVSFSDAFIETFKTHAAARALDVSTATGIVETGAFFFSAEGDLPGAPNPRYQALQVPIFFDDVPGEPVQIVDQDFVDDAQANGLAVHVWTIDESSEMHWLLDLGVNGIMTDVPSTLEKILKKRS
jgi:glycerophosphoryl diester phosphodiesterase